MTHIYIQTICEMRRGIICLERIDRDLVIAIFGGGEERAELAEMGLELLRVLSPYQLVWNGAQEGLHGSRVQVEWWSCQYSQQ